uniref:Uncharacterized protein n=1 Tax=Arundo donax TaxID=35708 RepID=A0A0A9DA10_ARUDO
MPPPPRLADWLNMLLVLEACMGRTLFQRHQPDITALNLRFRQQKTMGLRVMACWPHSQLDGRAPICIRWL